MKKLFTLALVCAAAVTAMTFTSCEKGGGDGPRYSYTWGGESYDIGWAGYYYFAGAGYSFVICPTEPEPGSYPWEEPYNFSVDIPVEMLDQKCDLSQDCDGGSWGFFGYFYDDGTEYWFEDKNNDSDNVTGDDNWVKVTKNSGTDNFTLEFAMTIDGKRLTGKYTGVFEVRDL